MFNNSEPVTLRAFDTELVVAPVDELTAPPPGVAGPIGSPGNCSNPEVITNTVLVHEVNNIVVKNDALYFSSVLSIDSSQKILDLLTHTKFPDKMAAGVSSEVIVAHKIGNFIDKEGNEAFSDCGIVYIPRRPYLLCMISRTDEQTAKGRMQDVSRMIYDFTSSINPPQKVN